VPIWRSSDVLPLSVLLSVLLLLLLLLHLQPWLLPLHRQLQRSWLSWRWLCLPQVCSYLGC
jgi:hypothetical protein